MAGGRSEAIDQGQGHAVQGMEAEPVGVNANTYIREKLGTPSLSRVVEDAR
jgi:DNA primase